MQEWLNWHAWNACNGAICSRVRIPLLPPRDILEGIIETRKHYTYLINILIDAYNAGKLPEIKDIIVEPEYGYVASIKYNSGEHRVLYGHDPGFNSGSAEQLANDKGYTKFLLRENGIDCARGSEFLLPWWADMLRQSDRQQFNHSMRDTKEALGYIDKSLGFPVYVKPSRGSQGVGVARVETAEELDKLLNQYNEERVKVAVIEEELKMPDYRILVFDDEVVNAYERRPFSVKGDGVSNLEQLIDLKHKTLVDSGRDIHFERQLPIIMNKLRKMGLSMTDIIPEGADVRLMDISNLSAGGMPVDVGEVMHQRWRDLAVRVARIFDLRICGVDLACKDITQSDSEYGVIEVNATPGVKQFMASGVAQQEKLEDIFVKFFRTL